MVFDACAWVEYALGTAKSQTVADLLDSASEALTPASVVAELKESLPRHGIGSRTIFQIIRYIESRTIVVGIDAAVAERAGQINFERKKTVRDWGMLDSLVYSVALIRNARILTGDPHFKRLGNVVYIGP